MGLIISLLLAFSSILDPNGSDICKQTDMSYSGSKTSTSTILDPNGSDICTNTNTYNYQ